MNYSKLNLVFDTPNSKLLELYHEHDIFVHPTMLEAGHPNLTMVEAAASGLPVIADWEHETNFHGAWRAPRDVFEMDRGLKDILNNESCELKKIIDNYMQESFDKLQMLMKSNVDKVVSDKLDLFYNKESKEHEEILFDNDGREGIGGVYNLLDDNTKEYL